MFFFKKSFDRLLIMNISDCIFIDYIDDFRLASIFLGMFDDRQQGQNQAKQKKYL